MKRHRAALALDAFGDAGRATLRLELTLSLEDQALELGLLGCGQVFHLGDFGCDVLRRTAVRLTKF